jgi:hypothetical protein
VAHPLAGSFDASVLADRIAVLDDGRSPSLAGHGPIGHEEEGVSR